MIGNAASTLLAGTLPLEVFGGHVSSLTSLEPKLAHGKRHHGDVLR